ncbi:unnamed protein product [marine sediment metagenome]|uniref:Uncharacterized protein n=1 Tax=marine sediment metagenome TaxID=412755 RepID=X1CWC7_9ZZZZ
MFGKGSLRQALLGFFGKVPDGDGGTLPPQAALYAFCSNLIVDATDHAIEQLPGALASLGGSSAAKKAAKHSAFARGAQNLSEGGFGELAGIKEMIGGLIGKVGTGGKQDWMTALAPIFIEKMMKSSGGGNGAPASLPPSQQSSQAGNYHTGGKLGGM